MKTQRLTKKSLLNPFFKTLFVAFMLMTASCIERGSNSEDDNHNDEPTSSNGTKEISEVIFVDNGAVVPKPSVRHFKWTLKNAENILLSYTEQNDDAKNASRSDITVSGESLEAVRDEIERVAEFAEDAVALKRGKQPCIGMKSLDVAVVYNTGDTSRIAISGSVRCDPTLYPSVWALDSMATEMYRNFKGKPQ